MANRKLHDLKKVPVIVATIPIDNVVSITAEFQNDQFSVSNGINRARQVKNNDLTGTVTLVVTQDSNSHQLITSLYKSNISFPVTAIDKTTAGPTQAGIVADECRLTKPPNWVREAEMQDVEYVFVCTNLTINHSGAADA